MIYSKQKLLKAPVIRAAPTSTAAVIPAKAGIQKHNATGIYRKNPNPNGLDSRLCGNDEILDYGNLSGMIESIGKTTGIHRKNHRNPSEKTETPPPSFPHRRESSNRKTTGIYRKKTHTPPTVIPAQAGIQKHNATGIYRKNPNPNGLDSRLRGNDEILSWGNLSENPNPQKPGRCRTIRPQTPFTHSNKQKEKTK